jgi:hypothetical protein
MTEHHVTFSQNRITGLYRGTCVCGWLLIAPTLFEVQIHASTHDLDQWQEIKPEEKADA